MDRKRFFKELTQQIGRSDINLIEQAYWLAKTIHRPQIRDDGERYFEHVRGTAVILLEYPSATSSEIIMSLLHDSVEDQFPPDGLLRRLFGREVENGVLILSEVQIRYEDYGVISKTKKTKSDYYGGIAQSSKSIRRVKCADRIHNLSNLLSNDVWPKDRKIRKVEETRSKVLPIAAMTDQFMHDKIKELCERIENTI